MQNKNILWGEYGYFLELHNVKSLSSCGLFTVPCFSARSPQSYTSNGSHLGASKSTEESDVRTGEKQEK